MHTCARSQVGSSSDGFWPPPSRILPIARESALPARYAAWAVGPMLQLADLTIHMASGGGRHVEEAGTAASLNLTLQNNGLGAYTHTHEVCALGAPPSTTLQASAHWVSSPADGSPNRLCTSLSALGARTDARLPLLPVSWAPGQKAIELTVVVRPSANGDVGRRRSEAKGEVHVPFAEASASYVSAFQVTISAAQAHAHAWAIAGIVPHSQVACHDAGSHMAVHMAVHMPSAHAGHGCLPTRRSRYTTRRRRSPTATRSACAGPTTSC